ncbi:MAG: DUF3667 domain-containing protein [Prevotella sp.]|nr:DUF3667 domain-containing protein [Prevotella sp.]
MTDIKRTWTYLSDSRKRTIWFRAIRVWQHRPHQVKPIADTLHQCSTCNTTYQGNYCPRCGQSAAIGRFSFKNAFLLFLDVWGLGNRGMFRSIRDLMLRPGYMIHDYLRGMQSAYFPPFKMFFLFTAFSYLAEHGISLSKEPDTTSSSVNISAVSADSEIILQKASEAITTLQRLSEISPAIFALAILTIFSIPLYLLFRRSPRIPDLRYAEFVVTLVYTVNGYTIFSIIGELTHLAFIQWLAPLMFFITLKQFSGYSNIRTAINILSAAVIVAITGIIFIAVSLTITALIYM